MHKIFLVFVAVLIASSFSFFANAQETEIKPSPLVSGGVVNGKATSLVKPTYPPAAKAVRASGAVNVQVLIDEEGKVVSASATSGHPLLRAAAVQAARQSTFLPTTLQGKPVKVSGIIVYNFVGDSLSPSQIGYALALAEKMSELTDDVPIFQISYSIPDQWTEVNSEVARLQIKQRQENVKRNQNKSLVTGQETPNETQKKVEESKGVAYVQNSRATGGVKYAVQEEIKESHTEIIGNLTNLLKARYANDEVRNWEFSLGLQLGKLKAQLDDDSALRINLNELNVLAQSAPASIPADFVNSLKTIGSYTNKAEIGTAEKAEIENFLRRVR